MPNSQLTGPRTVAVGDTGSAAPASSPAATGRGRMIGTLVDQVLSSASSFLVMLLVLRRLDLAGVGAYTLGYTFSTLMLVLVRPLVLEPLLIRYTVADPSDRLAASRRAVAAAAAIGLLLGEGAAAASLAVPGKWQPVVLVSGLTLPVVLIQDAWRFHFLAAGRPWSAAANDASCLLATAVLAVVVPVAAGSNVTSMLVIWGLGPTAGVLLAHCQTRSMPSVRGAWSWLGEQWRLGVPLAGAMVLTQVAGRLVPLLAGLIAGVGAVGLIYAGLAIFMPINTLISAGRSFALPEGVRRRGLVGRRGLNRFVLVLSAGFAAVVVLFAGSLLLVPDGIGEFYAGHSWGPSRAALLPVALWVAGGAAVQGPYIGLQVHAATSAVLRCSMLWAIAQLVGVSVGAFRGGAIGAAWGIGVGSLAGLLCFWRSYHLESRGNSHQCTNICTVPAPRAMIVGTPPRPTKARR